MFTEFTAQSQIRQQEQELTRTLERRRVAAERLLEQHGGERLALIAALARESRGARRTGRAAAGAPRPVAG